MRCEDCGCDLELRVGGEVPEFKIETFDPVRADWGEFSLAHAKANKRWTILFFYPGDFTFVWATEFAALAEQHERFSRMGADIVTVSTDSKHVHLAWQREENGLRAVKFPMGSDRTGNLARSFGVYLEEAGEAMRGTFIISPEGVLLAKEVNFDNVGRNIDELMRKFKAFLHVSRHPAKVCPSKWKEESDKTLEPSPKLVGAVYQQDGELGG